MSDAYTVMIVSWLPRDGVNDKVPVHRATQPLNLVPEPYSLTCFQTVSVKALKYNFILENIIIYQT